MKIFLNLLVRRNVNMIFTLYVKALFPLKKRLGNKHVHRVLVVTQMLLLCL